MKPFWAILLLVLASCLYQPRTIYAQRPDPGRAGPSATNRVLELDGNGSYVELPENIFTNLTEATVESWVKWEAFMNNSRVFDFGIVSNETYLANAGTSSILKFLITAPDQTRHRIEVPGILQLDQWYHIAAVTGQGGVRLYCDGVLVGTNSYSGSLSTLSGRRNYLGRSNFRVVNTADANFRGQISEVRVWRVARTEDQIRQNMFKKLTGREAELLGLWNFNDPQQPARDASPNGYHGILKGGACLALSKLPTEYRPTVLTGTVTDAAGKRLRNAEVRLQQNGVAARTDVAGEYRLTFFPKAPEDTVVVRLAGRGELLLRRANIRLDQPGLRTMDFVLQEPPGFAGRILSADGLPRAGVKVQLELANSLRSSRREEAQTPKLDQSLLTSAATNEIVAATVSNARGEYAFRDIGAGKYRVGVVGSDGPVYLHDGSVIEVTAEMPPIQEDIRLPPPRDEGAVAAAESQPNRMLQLDGKGGYVQLPPGIFDDLDEATVEGWVKWERAADDWPGFYLYGGRTGTKRRFFITGAGLPGFQAFIGSNSDGFTGFIPPSLIEIGMWNHIAVVLGPSGMKWFFNGQLLETRAYTGSFSTLKGSDFHVLGWSTWGRSGTFHGQMDEVRVWAAARSEVEVRENMFKRLTGQEEGLAALWNFDGDDARDATPNRFEGEMKQGAQTTALPLPAATDLRTPAVLAGRVTDEKGNFLTGVPVVLLSDGQPNRSVVSGLRGDFRFWLHPTNALYTLTAATNELSLTLTNFALHPGTTNVDLVLRRFASLSGKVTAHDGSPLEGVVVQALGDTRPIQVGWDGFLGEYFHTKIQASSDRFPELPSGLEPFSTQKEQRIDFPRRGEGPSLGRGQKNGDFFARWTGKFRLSRPGRFQFVLAVEDAGRVFLDRKLFIDTGGPKSWTVQGEWAQLEAGEHDLKVEFHHGVQWNGCQLQWQEEGTELAPFPEVNALLASTLSDTQGEYRFPALPEGRYQVRIHVPAGLVYAANGKTFVVERSRQTEGVDFETAPFKKGRGRSFRLSEHTHH